MPSPSRRSFLRLAGVSAVAGLGGCLDAGLSALNQNENRPTRIRWRTATDGLPGNLALADGGLYVITSWRIHRLSPTDGSVIWTVLLDSPDDTVCYVDGLAVDAGHVVTAGCDGIRSLSPTDGTTQWFVGFPTTFQPPAIANETVYTSQQEVTALDATDGTVRWRALATELRDLQYTRPTVAEGTVFVGGEDGDVHALRGDDGTTRWDTDLELAETGVPLCDDETVYVGGDNYRYKGGGALVALDAADGTERWRATTASVVADTAPALAEDRVFLATTSEPPGTPHRAETTRWQLVAHHRGDGRHLWTFETGDRFLNQPVVSQSGETVFVGGHEHFYAVNAADGSQRWRIGLGDSVAPISAGETVYIAGSDGVVALGSD